MSSLLAFTVAFIFVSQCASCHFPPVHFDLHVRTGEARFSIFFLGLRLPSSLVAFAVLVVLEPRFA